MASYSLPWEEIKGTAALFINELKREISASHPLWGKHLSAIAKRADKDEVLFKVDDHYAIVHLTWKGKQEEDPCYPITKLFRSFEEFHVRMLKDNEGWDKE